MGNFYYSIHKKPFICTIILDKESSEEYLVAKPRDNQYQYLSMLFT